MKRVVVVGTLHGGLTPNNELEDIFERYNPNQILIEINQEDINKSNIDSYPSEMIFSYEWAKRNEAKVGGFDSKINVFKEGVTEKDNKGLIEQQEKIIKNYSWTDFNRKEIEKLLDDENGVVSFDSRIQYRSYCK